MLNPLFLVPAETLATLLRALGWAIGGMVCGNRLANPVIRLVTIRLTHINQRFARLVARLAAGTYQPRRYHGRKGAIPKQTPPNPMFQKFGWLLPLLPEAVQHRSHLEHIFQDPAMLELLAAAPAPMARILRPLCWMLRVTPPPILALPARPRPPKKTTAAPTAPPVPQPPAPQVPDWLKDRRKPWSMARIRGSPHRA